MMNTTQLRTPYAMLLSLLCIVSWSLNAASIDDKVSAGIIKLLELTGIECEHDLKSVVAATQKGWLRPAGKERWEIEESLDAKTTQAIFNICASEGYAEAVLPKVTTCTFLVIYGSTLPNMTERLKWAEKLLKKGHIKEVGQVVLLGGERDLCEQDKMPDLFPDSGFPEGATTEAHGLEYLFLNLKGLKRLREIPYKLINAPKIQTKDGGWTRPTTVTTLQTWMKEEWMQEYMKEASEKSEKISAILVSTQPHGPTQLLAGQVTLPSNFVCIITAKKAGSEYTKRPLLLLDTVARTLYSQLHLLKQQAQKDVVSK